MACEIIWEEKGILFKHTGIATSKEGMEMIDEMYADSRFDRLKYQISDFTTVTNFQLTDAEAKIFGILDRTSSRWNTNRMFIAFVTQDEKFIPLVNTYFEQFKGTDWQCRIFETLDKAYDWVKSEL